jgi:hypothetical protein
MSDVSENEVRELIGRIVVSHDFRRAPRLREFLAYTVECTLSSRLNETTETRIGTAVFGRHEGYNPSEDSIVRSEARLLRQKLSNYFATEGAAENLLIEIPKGSYAAVIKPRPASAPQPEPAPPAPATPPPSAGSRSKPNGRAWLSGGLLMLMLAAGLVWAGLHERRTVGSVGAASGIQVTSSDPRLSKRFQAVKSRALQAVHSGGTVGEWYDAYGTTVGIGFNMRDFAHDASGAAELGLVRQNRSMLSFLTASVSASRDWAGYWEMTPYGKPMQADYKNDQDFRYCLPANFDLLAACYRQYQWTGDPIYLSRPFLDFYRHTIEDYVHAWDREGNGMMQSSPDRGLRGIPSYNQQQPRSLTGADLVAAQYAGYRAFADFAERLNDKNPEFSGLAHSARAKAEALKDRFNSQWWDPDLGRYHSALLPDRTFYSGYIAESLIFPLKFELVEPGKKAAGALDSLEAEKPPNPQGRSYVPEVLFQYGRDQDAYQTLLELSDPDYFEIPEIAFAMVDAVTSGLAGIAPDVPRKIITTRSHLPKDMEFVKLEGVPVGPNAIAIRHEGRTVTRFTNQSGPSLQWKASFALPQAGIAFRVLVDDVPVSTQTESTMSGPTAFVFVPVAEGQTRIAQIEFSSNQMSAKRIQP